MLRAPRDRAAHDGEDVPHATGGVPGGGRPKGGRPRRLRAREPRAAFPRHRRLRAPVASARRPPEVCAARDLKVPGNVAIKRISDAFASYVCAKRTLREVRLLRLLDTHNNLIKMRTILPISTAI